jgi:REP element-mobilizing transposase RayT
MKTKPINEKLLPGAIYHIYNRAVGDELLFRSDDSYFYFLKKIKRFILPVSKIYAYCMIPNHFHLLLQIKEEDVLLELLSTKDQEKVVKYVNQSFSNFFNSYTVSVNRTFKRMGKLFMLPYKRILVESDDYFMSLINYIHRNPIHHGLTDMYDKWPHSSFSDYAEVKETFVDKDYVLDMFGGLEVFLAFHFEHVDLTGQE